jgi:hypothetical protein
MGLLSDEGDALDIMAGRYGDGTPNFGVYLRAHAAGEIRVNRVGRAPDIVSQAAATLGLAVQPSVLQGLRAKPGFQGRGLLARFAYALPTSLVGHRDPNPQAIPAAERAAYRALVRDLLGLPYASDVQGKPCPFELRLDEGAQRQFRSMEVWIEQQFQEGGDLYGLSDWGGKLAGLIARLAAGLHMAQRGADPRKFGAPITEQTMAAAIRIGQYLIAHARSAYVLMGTDSAVHDAQYVLERITDKGASSFAKQEVWQWCRGRFGTAQPLTTALDHLVARGYLREQPLTREEKRGRPSVRYLVNPRCLVQQGNSRDCRDSRQGGATQHEDEEEEMRWTA